MFEALLFLIRQAWMFYDDSLSANINTKTFTAVRQNEGITATACSFQSREILYSPGTYLFLVQKLCQYPIYPITSILQSQVVIYIIMMLHIYIAM